MLALNGLLPMATELLPATLRAADAFGLTQDASEHAVSRLHAAMQLVPLTELAKTKSRTRTPSSTQHAVYKARQGTSPTLCAAHAASL